MSSDMLKILVIGAGPSGLAFSIELAQRWRDAKIKKPNMIDLQITVRDIRIEQRKANNGMFVNVGARSGRIPGRRRDQVVTIQDDVCDHLSPLIKKQIFANYDERVWPTSRNIPIREIEDQLLLLAQKPQFRDTIVLEGVNDQSWKENVDAFQIIVGADGARSKTRHELFDVEEKSIVSHGEDTALGIAFQVPEIESGANGLPFEQKVNCILTIAQRRYLLNASKVSRSGYLNIQLSRDEMTHVLTKDGRPCVWENPGYLNTDGGVTDDLFKPYFDHRFNKGTFESRRLWEVIMDGLALFGIKKRHVTNIVGIKLPIRSSPNFTFELKGGDGDRWGFLVGDAAFSTHFWPGRGLNSALKEVAMLAWCLADVFSIANRLRRNEIIHVQYFKAFMAALREREHTHRSIIFLCGISMIKHVNNAVLLVERLEPANIDTLFDRIISARNRLNPDDNSSSKDLTGQFKEADVKNLLGEMSLFTLNAMTQTGAWPRAPGNEILPRAFIGQSEFLLPEINENVCLYFDLLFFIVHK